MDTHHHGALCMNYDDSLLQRPFLTGSHDNSSTRAVFPWSLVRIDAAVLIRPECLNDDD